AGTGGGLGGAGLGHDNRDRGAVGRNVRRKTAVNRVRNGGAGNVFRRAAFDGDAANAVGVAVDEVNPFAVGRAAGILVAVAGGELFEIGAIEIDAVDAASGDILAMAGPGKDDAVRFRSVGTCGS